MHNICGDAIHFTAKTTGLIHDRHAFDHINGTKDKGETRLGAAPSDRNSAIPLIKIVPGYGDASETAEQSAS